MKRFLLLLSLLPALGWAQLKPAEANDLLERMEAKTFTDTAGTTLPFRLLVPPQAKTQSLPLFLCMHGAGGRGNDNAKTIRHSPWALHAVASPAVQKKHPCIVVAPQCPNGKRWVDVDWNNSIYATAKVAITAEQTAAIALLKQVIKVTNADPKRIYVGGFSMGGYGTWDLVAREPGLFAAAVPVCGGADPARAAAMKDVAVWAFHGDRDGVVPPKGTRAMIKALQQAGAKPKYSELPGVGHNAWTPAWQNAKLVDWVFQQARP